MHVGHYISGAGHIGLIAWLLLGSLLSPAREPFEVTEVSLISGAEFEAMVAAQQPPASATEVAQPAPPEVQPDQPEVVPTEDQQISQPEPLQAEAPTEDAAPEVVEPVAPPPAAEVSDTPPPAPEEPVGDVVTLAPEVAPEAAPRPIERVAPEAVAPPPPEAAPDPVPQEAVTPEAEGEAPEQEPQEARAPEEATTEIVTEATKAPAASTRPPGRRPAAPAPQTAAAPALEPARPEPTEAPEPQSDNPVDADAIAAAVAAAQSATEAPAAPAAPSGPPLTGGEKEALRVAVSACWNVGSLSSDALQTTVVVSVAMNQDGTPIVGSITMESSSGGSSAAARQAFEAARRAIIRCGASGYDLPAEKFGQWQTIEMTFNPERMRVK